MAKITGHLTSGRSEHAIEIATAMAKQKRPRVSVFTLQILKILTRTVSDQSIASQPVAEVCL
jgi:hypothetical protein